MLKSTEEKLWHVVCKIATKSPKSLKQILKKLMQKGITKKKSHQLVARLLEANIYSESACIDNIILHYKERAKGRFWIEKELNRREFPPILISQRINAVYKPIDEEQTLRGLWLRYKVTEHKNAKARFVATAWQRGFPKNLIFELVHEED